MKQSNMPNTSARKLGLDPVVAFSLAGAIAFFLISGLVAYLNLQSLRENNGEVVHSHDVIVALDELLSRVQDAETGQRGFLLSNNQRYLEPYNSAVAAIPQKLTEITELTSDNPAQQRRIGALKTHVEAKLAELKETIDLRGTQGIDAALAVVNSERGKVQMDAIRMQLSAMGKEESDLRVKRLAEMDGAYRTAYASSILSGLLGILLTAAIGVLLRRATLARRREEWLQSGHVGLSAAIMGDKRTEQLGESILEFLAGYAGAIAGAVFVGGKGVFRRASIYGVPDVSAVPEQFKLREGLLGQAAAEGRPNVVSDIPDGYITFGSALGRDKPRHLVISPGSVDGDVNTVIELGFLRPVDESVLVLLEQVSPSIATAVRSANYRVELQNLVEETQRQSEELQVQSEELRVSNEELEEQSRALKESQVRLEQQQVELEQTNSQLEEQTQQLEGQRDDLERANAAVQLKARELQQASQYKSDFLANMSHELRTPLNSSLILAKLLADNPDDTLTAEQVKYAQTIQSSGNDLLNLINDILDLSKIEAGHIDIRPEAVSVERLANNIRQLFQPIAENKRLTFDIDIAPECPAIIQTDLQRLEQVLKNLLSNAFKFTETGRVGLSIRRAPDGQIALAVTDSGIGIAEEQQRSIFEAFHQADGTISRKYGGTGLGLSISRELVRLLGGAIHLTSRQGHGSTFTITIPEAYDPATVAPRDARSTAVSAAPTISPAIETRAVSIERHNLVDDDRAAPSDEKRVLLVIEDDDTFAAILRDISREMGFRTLVAGTAQEALDLAKQFMPSAIVLDVGLPDQSGLSVLDRLKRDVRTRHIPIHIVSGDDHAETAFSLGAVGYMLKPVKREQLIEVLQKLEAKLSQRVHRVLIVEDNQIQRDAVAKLLTSHDVETMVAGTAAECLQLLKEQTFDCMVLDLSLPDASGYSLLETLSKETAYAFPPVIVYTGRVLSADDEQQLRRYSKSIIIKGAKSPERLLDEVTLFLHQVVSELPDEQQKMIRKARNRDALLEGRRILVVEDDVRNVYALTNILEPRGAIIEIARNGQEALDALAKAASQPGSAIDLVLMDVMMPVMDGLTATREIRRNADWKRLPIIALTAKAMPDDQQRCIDAGANDYMAKPLDVEKLLSLVRVWMPR
ncbi:MULTISPECIES: response regulator [Rhizobium/Agrobacterium group]|uniref:response regulator n=1 Tax=Rhizobium/Agrobacterium group TaxID=227290 RepID=UPI00071405E2|nr:response regulator [Rhizobium sp. Root483D2]KQY41429.1 histidine kinase [Rhizobium sp. Root483D2]